MNFDSGDVPHHIELNSIIQSCGGDGVLSGLAVTGQGSPSMILDVSAGRCIVDNKPYTELSTNTVTISTAHATLPRIDIVHYDTSAIAGTGDPVVTTGEPSATPKPKDTPDGDLLLAMVNVPAGDTAITTSQITDDRIFINLIGLVYSASDDLLCSDDPEDFTYREDYTKILEIEILPYIFSDETTLRIKFDLKSASSSYTAYGRIYRNGVAVGTERSTTSTSFVNYSEDISGWSSGDLIQVYTKISTYGIASVGRNLRAYGSPGIYNDW